MRLLISAFVGVSLAASRVQGAALCDPHNIFDNDFKRLVEDLLEQNRVPGISVAIICNGSIASEGFRYSVLPDTHADGDTLWYAGSTAKAFVAAAAAKIVMNNTAWPEVHWDTPLQHLLPSDFVLWDDYTTNHISLEDALSHRTGLPCHDQSYGWGPNNSTLDTVRLLRHLPPTAAPRTRYQYNNMMYTAVGDALEAVTSIPIGSLLQNWFWNPLGMQSTHWYPTELDENERKRLARSYFWSGEYYVPDPYIDLAALTGAGATISSVNDYALWIRALLATYTEDNATSPIDSALLEHVTTARTIIDIMKKGVPRGGLTAYALGWIIDQVGTQPRVSHTGSVPGFLTLVSMLPYAEFGFVSMENSRASSSDDALQADELLWQALLRRLELASDEHIATDLVETREPHHLPDLEGGHSLDTSEVYAGLYFNPGYGSLKAKTTPRLKLTDASLSSTQQRLMTDANPREVDDVARMISLQVALSSRLWPIELNFTHLGGDVFNSTVYRKARKMLPVVAAERMVHQK